VIFLNAATDQAIDLYPFIIFDGSRQIGKQFLLFNSLNKKTADFHDYVSGDRIRFESPNALPEDFQRRFPRPSGQAGALDPNWFGDFIENSTQHFVGRQDALAQIDSFAAGGSKR